MAINRKLVFYSAGILLILLGLLTFLEGCAFFGAILPTYSSCELYLFGFVQLTASPTIYLISVIALILIGIILLAIPKVKKWQ